MTTVIKESRTKGDAPMKRLVQFAALATAIASGIHVAAAAELPNFVSAGFPITALQVSTNLRCRSSFCWIIPQNLLFGTGTRFLER
jgi:hypothetical protein